MTHTVSDQLLSSFSDFVTARFGLHFPRKRWGDLARKIAALADDFGLADHESCVRWLVAAELTRSQLDTIAGRLTIGETYFFRERNSFDALEAHILLELIGARRGKEQRLRIWSAGCSTGEEAYSIAILLQRMIADLPRWNITILATDINLASLGKAAAGKFSDWSFRGIPSRIKERYFTRDREGRFEIAESIRKMVTFAPLNLAQDPYPSLTNNTNAMDVIFCRNVLMYFAPHQMEKVVDKFRHSLVAGGWLAVSPCETSHILFSRFASVTLRDAIFYRKDDRRQPAAPFPCEAVALPVPPPPAAFRAASPPCPAPQPAEPLPAATAEQAAAGPRVSPYEEALALYRQGLYAEAAAKLAVLPAGGAPVDGKAATLLARLFANQGDFAAALEWTEKAIAVNKLDPEVRYLQAIIFQEQGQIDTAIAALKKTLYLDQSFVLGHFALANLSRQQGKVREAARHLENAASLLTTYGYDDILPGSDGMSARRLGEIIAATMANI